MRLSNRQLSFALLGIVIVFVLIGAGLKQYFSGQLARKQFLQMAVNADCNPRSQSCPAIYDKRSIVLKLNESVSYLKPFQIEISTQGFQKSEIKRITVIFSMLAMEMGLNQYKLSETGAGKWQSQVILPVCSSGRTDWKIEVRLETDANHYRAVYPLQVD